MLRTTTYPGTKPGLLATSPPTPPPSQAPARWRRPLGVFLVGVALFALAEMIAAAVDADRFNRDPALWQEATCRKFPGTSLLNIPVSFPNACGGGSAELRNVPYACVQREEMDAGMISGDRPELLLITRAYTPEFATREQLGLATRYQPYAPNPTRDALLWAALLATSLVALMALCVSSHTRK